jgi:glycosyltransferase involved in cell wall biosynthesis
LSLYFFLISSLPHPGTFIKRELFNLYGNYSQEYKIVSDWLFFIKVFLNNCTYKKIPYTIASFDSGGVSSNVESSIIERSKGFDEIILNETHNIQTNYKLNIIITYFNKDKYIEQTILSWLNLSFITPYFIIVDDHSDVAFSTNILNNNNSIVIRNEYNLGVSSSRNIGLNYIKNEYEFTIFFDADDTVNNSIISLFEYLRNNVHIAATSNYFSNSMEKTKKHPFVLNARKKMNQSTIEMIFEFGIFEAFTLIKTEVLLNKKILWTQGLNYSEGIPFYCRLMSLGIIGYVDLECFNYNIDPNGLSKNIIGWKKQTQLARKEYLISDEFMKLNFRKRVKIRLIYWGKNLEMFYDKIGFFWRR